MHAQHHQPHDRLAAQLAHASSSLTTPAQQVVAPLPTQSATPHLSYKQLKEAWIADRQGSSLVRINLLSLTMITTYALWAVHHRAITLLAPSRDRQHQQHHHQPTHAATLLLHHILRVTTALSQWQLEFAILILPAIAAHTLLSDHLLLLNLAITLLAASIHLETNAAIRTSIPASQRAAPTNPKKKHWSKRLSDDDDDHIDEDHVFSDHLAPFIQGDTQPSADLEPPIRVSVDSAADAAHAAAAPNVPYSAPSASTDSETPTFRTPSPFSPLFAASPSSSADFRSASASEDSHAASRAAPLAQGLLPGGRNTRAGLALSTAQPAPSPPGSRLASPLLGPGSNTGSAGGGQWGNHRSSLSSSSPLSPLARSVIDPLETNKRAAARAPPVRLDPANPSLFVREQPFLTVYRSHMMLLTVICILAVDFPAFPRDFAKCESWGTSLMDLGVGSFVFSLGIVSALPLLRSPRNRFAPLKAQLLRDVRRTLPLVALGMVRVIMVKGVEYPEHVTEYGVHWNFFFTLALLPFAATLSRPLSRSVRYNYLGLAVTVAHQAVLKLTTLESWALSSTLVRDTLVRQNKEGLTSLPGYLAIFLLGLDLGHYALPLDPYFAYRRLNRRRMKARPGKLAMILASLGVIWWSAYAAADLSGLAVSRRLANLPYVLWVTAFNTTFLLGYVLVYVFVLKPLERGPTAIVGGQASSAGQVSSLANSGSSSRVTPRLLSDLNRHSLSVFLAANLLTGLVNVSIETMYAPDWAAVVVLTLYVGASCGLTTLLSRLGWKLRL